MGDVMAFQLEGMGVSICHGRRRQSSKIRESKGHKPAYDTVM